MIRLYFSVPLASCRLPLHTTVMSWKYEMFTGLSAEDIKARGRVTQTPTHIAEPRPTLELIGGKVSGLTPPLLCASVGGKPSPGAQAPSKSGPRLSPGEKHVTSAAYKSNGVRKPRADCHVKSHRLRPAVPAADRLTAWSSEWAETKKARLSAKYGSKVAGARAAITTAALDKDTRTSYGAGLLRYAQFCDAEGISEIDRVPAIPELVAAFVAASSGKVSGSCVHSWLAGLRAWHHVMGAAWCGDDPIVSLSRAAARKEGRSFSRPPRPPVTAEHLTALRAHLDLHIPEDVAVWAAASHAFWGCRRLGELLPESAAAFSDLFHPVAGVALKPLELEGGFRGLTYRLPWTKTTKEQGGSVVLIELGHVLCPIQALRSHEKINGGRVPSDHLFAFRSQDGNLVPLTKAKFLDRCNRIWKVCGLTPLSGHCFRIGGTTHWLLQGAPTEIVAAIGGWTSLSFLLYWRRVETIIASGLAGAASKEDGARVGARMELFRKKHKLPAGAS
jgi:hypothetical protein